MSKKNVSKVYTIVTEQILRMLDQGVAPWRKPWKGLGGNWNPLNVRTKRPYRGSNIFLLWSAAHELGVDSPYWGTWKAWEEQGGTVKETERKRSALTFVYRPIPIWDEEEKEKPVEERGDPIFFKRFLRYFRTWNADQVEGVEHLYAEEEEGENEFTPIETAENIAGKYLEELGGPGLVHSGHKASYTPSQDLVRMPDPERFDAPPLYYSTLFHELVHSTGHKERLDRKDGMEQITFGSHDYSFEELVAEFGAAMLSAVTGIEQETIENSAGYIDHWRQALGENPTWLIQAGAKASAAADHIQGITWEKED